MNENTPLLSYTKDKHSHVPPVTSRPSKGSLEQRPLQTSRVANAAVVEDDSKPYLSDKGSSSYTRVVLLPPGSWF